MVKKCQDLDGYVQFISQVKGNLQNGYSRDEAISAALSYCITNGIIADFLKSHGSEVMNMIYTEFNMDDAIKIWKRDGREEGKAEGKREQALTIAESLLSDGDSIEKVVKVTGLPREEVERLKNLD